MTRVSDHALLRYLERSQGIDVEGIRASILTQLARAEAAARKLGVETYSIRLHGVQFIVRHETVTTVLDNRGDGARFHALGPRDL